MMEELLHVTVTDREAGQTIRDVLQKHCGVSRRLLVRAKYQGAITRNGSPVYVTERVQAGDRIAVWVPVDEVETVQPEPMPLAIRWEDDDLLVVAKPAGLVVHPTGNYSGGTLANGVAAYWQARGETRKFRPVNRLDKDTSGLLIVAKNQWMHEQFSRMQKERSLHRTYQAIVHGTVAADEGVVDAPIGLQDGSIIVREVRPDGQAAVTRYRVLQRGREMSWLELKLETGRTHQIRVHMRYLGHPLIGDDLYGGSRDEIGRQALHAVKLSFRHPRSGQEMLLEEPLPGDMEQVLARFFTT